MFVSIVGWRSTTAICISLTLATKPICQLAQKWSGFLIVFWGENRYRISYIVAGLQDCIQRGERAKLPSTIKSMILSAFHRFRVSESMWTKWVSYFVSLDAPGNIDVCVYQIGAHQIGFFCSSSF